jgi:hypothetical protein
VIALGASDEQGIPVTGDSDDQIVGWLTHRRVLRTYRRRLNQRRSTPPGSAAAQHED